MQTVYQKLGPICFLTLNAVSKQFRLGWMCGMSVASWLEKFLSFCSVWPLGVAETALITEITSVMLIEAKLLRTRPRTSTKPRGRGQNHEAEAEDRIARPRTRPRTFFLVWKDIHIVSNYTRQSSHACMPHTKKLWSNHLCKHSANSHPGKSDGCK